MKISRRWLQTYFDTPLPSTHELVEHLTFHAFEIDGVEEIDDDEVLDVKVTPNRGHDCLSHRGIAHELSAILARPLSRDPLATEPNLTPETNSIEVTIQDEQVSPRYVAAHITGVSVGPSPEWLVRALLSMGQRSVNNIVDVTNYVMFDMGQPLHAFDAGKLGVAGGQYRLCVRRAKPDEQMLALDGKTYTLSQSSLAIGDEVAGVAVGVAGVKGGMPAGITESTHDIIIESANFDGVSVRLTSRALRLRTDASQRFEQGLAPELAARGMRAVVDLIQQIAGGSLVGFVDTYPQASAWQYRVGVSLLEIERVLGVSVTEESCADAFSRLGFSYEYESVEDALRAAIPDTLGAVYKNPSSMRADAPGAFSCSSLVSYLYTRAGVWMPSLSVDKYVFGMPIERGDLRFGDCVFSNSGNGRIYTETVEYRPGTPVPEGVDHVGIYVGDGRVLHAARAANGVIEEDLETSPAFANIIGFRRMVPDLAEKRFVVNIPFERLDLRIKEDLIEEVARMIGYDAIPSTPLPVSSITVKINGEFAAAERARQELLAAGYSEVYTSVFADRGERLIANKIDGVRPYLRMTLIDGLAEALKKNIPNKDLLFLKKVKLFEIGTVWKHGREITMLGVAEEGKTPTESPIEPVSDVTTYADVARSSITRYQPFSRYPYIVRDIAFWIPAETSEDSVLELIRAHAGALLVRAVLFDRFEKAGRVSLAYRLVFQSFERTLTEEEAEAALAPVAEALRARGYEIR